MENHAGPPNASFRIPVVAFRGPFRIVLLPLVAGLLFMALLILGLGVAQTDADFDEEQFRVTVQADGVLVEWVTLSESDHESFEIWRSTSPSDYGVNVASIGARGGFDGTSYTWTDLGVQPGVTYYYWVESLATDGFSEFYGPRSVTAGEVPEDTPTPTTTATATLTATVTPTPTGTVTVTTTPDDRTPTSTPTPTEAPAAIATETPSRPPTPRLPTATLPPSNYPEPQDEPVATVPAYPAPGAATAGPAAGPGSAGGSPGTPVGGPAFPAAPSATARALGGLALPTVTPRAVGTIIAALNDLNEAESLAEGNDEVAPAPPVARTTAVDVVLLVLNGGLIVLSLLAVVGTLLVVRNASRR